MELLDEARRLLAESQKRVPVKTGALKASGKLTRVETASGPRVEISYGGESAPYATYVHEAGRTGKKFLEHPAIESLPEMRRRFRDRLGAAIKKALG